MREMYRIGRIRPLSFEDFAATVAGPNGPAKISGRASHPAWVRALHLILEMQERARGGPRTRFVDLVEDAQRWLQSAEQPVFALAAAREEDTRLLEELKNTLTHGVQVFGELEVETRQRGSRALLASCRRAMTSVQEYCEHLDAKWRLILSAPALRRGRTSSHWPAANIRRLHDSEFWLQEEFPEQRIALLHRTPLPTSSLPARAADNGDLLAAFTRGAAQFRAGGRHSRGSLAQRQGIRRNHGKAASGVGRRFERAAVLLDSTLGELQVSRLERVEGAQHLHHPQRDRGLPLRRRSSLNPPGWKVAQN